MVVRGVAAAVVAAAALAVSAPAGSASGAGAQQAVPGLGSGVATRQAAVGPVVGVPAGMRSAADSYVAAMAGHDVARARTYVRADSSVQAEELLDWSKDWSSATSADCRGLICTAVGAASTPEPSFLMRKARGRWWVAGVVAFPSWGPGQLLHTSTLFDPYSGNRATSGLPAGTSYWALDDKGNASYLKLRRTGRTVRLLGWTPAVARIHAEQFSCGTAVMDRDGLNVEGSAVRNDLPVSGTDERYGVEGPVWRSGAKMHAMALVQAWIWVDDEGGTRDLTSWRRSTWKKTGGSHWTSVERRCSSHAWP